MDLKPKDLVGLLVHHPSSLVLEAYSSTFQPDFATLHFVFQHPHACFVHRVTAIEDAQEHANLHLTAHLVHQFLYPAKSNITERMRLY